MISLLELGELKKQARNCEYEPFQNAVFENVFNIPDYNFFMKNTQMDVFIHSTYAYCFLLNFITQHNKQLLKCISEPVYEKSTDSVYLATHCLKQLNIINTDQSTNNKYSSVLNMMNRCKTAMGRRKMKDIILHPSTNIAYLNNEYQIIEHIIDLNNISPNFIDDTRKNLINIHDIEKIYRKIILNIMKPSELVLIYYSIVSFRKTCERLLKDEDIYNYIHNKTNGEDIIPSINTLISLFEKTLIIDNCNEDRKRWSIYLIEDCMKI